MNEFLPYQMSTASRAVSGLIIRDYYERFGLSVPEWRVLAILGEGVGLTQSDLCGETRMDKVAINRAVKALVEDGMVCRTPNENDGRSHHLHLTEHGQEIFDQLLPHGLAVWQRICEPLSDEELAQLTSLVLRLRDEAERLAAENGGSLSRGQDTPADTL
jgi:DNA-binding MarR family transcriptional regulator